jgi:hypothetical protein
MLAKLCSTGLVVAVTAFLAGAGPGQAPAQVAPAEQARKLMRVLAHDFNFASRFPDEIAIAVLHRGDDPAGVDNARLFVEVVASLNIQNNYARPVRVFPLAVQPGDDVADLITKSGAGVVYLCSGLEGALPAIVKATDHHDIVSVGATYAMVAGGASFGIVEYEGRSRLVINLQRSQLEGTHFSAMLLNIAELVQ